MAVAHPQVTVLIPTFNREKYLAECLDSILGQSLPASQIIVVNDGSKDNTVSLLQPYRNKIDYLETNQVGKPSAINSGLKKITGKYLWIFDDDDVALDFALERFVEPLEKHPEYGFSYSTFFYTGTNKENDRIGSVIKESTVPDLESKGFFVPLLEENFLGGAALFARSSCYEKVGKFDPELVRSQDYEMAIRISRHFNGIRVEGGATFHYRQHEGKRGATRDRFGARDQKRKWWFYGQMFFQRLYSELPLEDYLPPKASMEKFKRQALLQRIGVMASKLLFDEIDEDVHQLARIEDLSEFSKQEEMIIDKFIIKIPYYKVGSLYDHLEFFDLIRQLSASSPLMKKMRKSIVWALFKRAKIMPSFSNSIGSLSRIIRLYIG